MRARRTGLTRRAAGIAYVAALGAAAVAWILAGGDGGASDGDGAGGGVAVAAGRAAPVDEPGARFFAEGAMFAIECGFAGAAAVDPIVSPGQRGAHLHDFFGSTEVDVSSTGASLVGGDTTCRKRQDTAAYWAPALLDGGVPVEPLGATAYYRVAPGVDPAEVVPFPLGLAAIAGDAGATADQPTSVVGWACGRGGSVTAMPAACGPREPLELRVTFPDCWDGERLDSPDHTSHLAYSGPDGCEGDHPVALPRLTLVVHYPVTGDPSRLTLASGSPRTAHADFLNGWDVDALAREVRSCLHLEVVCGIPDATRTAS